MSVSPRSPVPPRSIPRLLIDAVRDAQDLAVKEIALFRAEVGGGLRALGLSLSLFAATVIVVITGLMVLLMALVKALSALLGSEILGPLIVGGAFAAVAIGLAFWGASRMSLQALEPARTEREMARDAALIREHIGR